MKINRDGEEMLYIKMKQGNREENIFGIIFFFFSFFGECDFGFVKGG